MNILNLCVTNIIAFLVLSVCFDQTYKVATKTSKKDGALTVLLEFMAAIIAFICIPFFELKFPTDIKTYLLFIGTIVFFAITDRLNTTVRRGIEASTFNMLRQIATVFIMIAGVLIFKESLIITKVIGAILIIFSNILIFYKKEKIKVDKYLGLGILANITFTVAMLMEIEASLYFNPAFFIGMTLLGPAILITLFERIKISDIKEEFKIGNKKAIFVTAITWGLSILAQVRAYNLGDVTLVAPLCALTVILNVIAGYMFLNEKDNISKKIIAGILITISVFLIKG